MAQGMSPRERCGAKRPAITRIAAALAVAFLLLALYLAGCGSGGGPGGSDPRENRQPPGVPAGQAGGGEQREDDTASNLARVLSVTDGDTIRVLLPDGREEAVRYIGINTPELDQPYGPEAKTANASLVEGKQVRLEMDVSERDRYGRLLRYVFVDDLFVNAELVRRGYAQVATYPPDVAHAEEFLELQRQAQAEGAGLWAPASQPAAPSIPWSEAASHVGETATVVGPVVGTKYSSTSKGKPTFLDLGADYPDPRRFTVVIWGEHRGAFPSPPETLYRGKTITITGRIELYQGVPEVEVTSPSQITIQR